MVEPTDWLDARKYTPEKLELALVILNEIRLGSRVEDAVRKHPLPGGGGHVAKHVLVHVYRAFVDSGEWDEDPELLQKIRMKPVRTLSGVTTVTVLTKPYPCPGNCIFCPTEECEPKSYLSDEPGARRALQNNFDPFAQVTSRLQALSAVGHPTDKIELLILGGTFSAYRKDYQSWFVMRCYQALNQKTIPSLPGADLSVTQEGQALQTLPTDPVPPMDETLDRLNSEHDINTFSSRRNVGLVLETRPDEITYKELAWLRSLGATKLQMGAQSLDDHILEINKRGHTVEQTVRAMLRLRAAGFKVVLHWMPNLLGATPESDVRDFRKLWGDGKGIGGLCPDEIKIYPTQLLQNSELYQYYLRGEYHPYTESTLVTLLADVKSMIPPIAGSIVSFVIFPAIMLWKGTGAPASARMHFWRWSAEDCVASVSVAGRSGENMSVTRNWNCPTWFMNRLRSPVNLASTEHFISYVTGNDQIAGYMRLSFPQQIPAERDTEMPDLIDSAIIREIHVYGQALAVGADRSGSAQHIGLGTKLIGIAAEKARMAGYKHLSVISAIGTREYYRKRGFTYGSQYQIMDV